jgi:hypothetical protein
MESSLQQMMAHFLAEMKTGNVERKAGINAEMKAAQTEMEVRAEVRLEWMEVAMNSMRSDIEQCLHQQMGALIEGSKSCGTSITICQVSSD